MSASSGETLTMADSYLTKIALCLPGWGARRRRWLHRSRIVQKSQLLAPSTPSGPGPMPRISDSDLMGVITNDSVNVTPIAFVCDGATRR